MPYFILYILLYTLTCIKQSSEEKTRTRFICPVEDNQVSHTQDSSSHELKFLHICVVMPILLSHCPICININFLCFWIFPCNHLEHFEEDDKHVTKPGIILHFKP